MDCGHNILTFGCQSCIDGPAPGQFPAWYTPGKDKATQNRNAGRGLHPLGMRLGPDGSTCGTCEHRISRGRYLKCGKSTASRGPATDIRAKYQGCELWSIRSHD